MLRDRIKAAQSRDPILVELVEKVREGKFVDFNLDYEGVLWISGRLCINAKWQGSSLCFKTVEET